ncbi:serine carboxypeptidase-like 20 isoform X2 [Pyrus x bretschneideri]|uniref:serine carboxypeptidase-like 20 isoform X2 n=1 Tax=Pyrus x bretschneideri TaxID=225117 RepID=UPI00202FFDF0|nr:serine carboxypeptidase-like 20 isoform X2 [Pyrus x bretschneideri]
MAGGVLYLFFVPLIYTFLSILPTQSAPQSALVTQIPGFSGTLPSKHYAGYVTVDQSHGRNLFYYFVESEGKPAEDPVVLWLNGGPGCSSLDGFVYEHGPFNFEKAMTKGSLLQLHLNPYSWSKWFELYPEFLSNPFFIAGESYAGVYVPTLSSEVVKGIDAGVTPVLNFKGYLVGNGVTDDKFDGNALVPFAHGMGLISDDLYEEVNTACGGKYIYPVNDACGSKLEKVDKNIEDLNIYDILEPCYHSTDSSKNRKVTKSGLPSSFRRLGETERPLAVRKRMFGRAWPLRAPVRDGIVPTWPELMDNESVPCINDEVATEWLNNESVRKAIHAETDFSWELCTSRIEFYHDSGSMIKYHMNLTAKGYRALIYSGDHDMCVPFTGSEAWTRSLGYKIVDEWRPWTSNGQVAGYTQGYENNLTFLTVKGSGHTVPEYKPREAFDLFSRFLAGKPQ